ncbi:hypothetical protein EKO23_08840 [Nocardioides guangzhouensis]|uniref:Uncharacterized protein n=1 Tax=Nocardioides guangzhouensis TaxID=2497878 RepID=A0A4Q4ZF52_9ACTN|nr:hypothetical protein [Nocardioides guangzhouensis]RYP86752.1 hypothetical protein EKO23_08840 [Nocardioides guangzhouensis]
MDLDELLERSGPPICTRGHRLEVELRRLVRDSETTAGRRRRSVRLGLAGVAVAGVLGLAPVASAAGLLPGWATWSTTQGSTCELQLDVGLRRDGDGELITETFTDAEQRATYAAAREFLTAFDYDSVDRDAAIAEWQAQEAHIRAGQRPGDRQPALQGDDLEVTAVLTQVVNRLRDHLHGRGLDIRAIMVSAGNRCTR